VASSLEVALQENTSNATFHLAHVGNNAEVWKQMEAEVMLAANFPIITKDVPISSMAVQPNEQLAEHTYTEDTGADLSNLLLPWGDCFAPTS